MKKYLPLFINLEGKKCVVVGGGKVAERKIKTLLKYGAKVTVVSPEITKKIAELVEKKKIQYLKKKYSSEDIEDAFLVIAATSDSSINQQILNDAKFLVNSVESSLSINSSNISVIFPAIFERDSLQIAVSTEFPALSKTIRDELKQIYGKEFASYIEYLKKLRLDLREKIVDSKKRREVFRKIASQRVVSKLRQEGFKKAKEEIESIINEA